MSYFRLKISVKPSKKSYKRSQLVTDYYELACDSVLRLAIPQHLLRPGFTGRSGPRRIFYVFATYFVVGVRCVINIIVFLTYTHHIVAYIGGRC